MININTVYNMDCKQGLSLIEDEIIDLTITSPPYNIGNIHRTGRHKHTPYFDDLPEEDYQNQQIEILNEIFRVTKKSGSLFYNHKNRIKDRIQISPYAWIFKTKWLIKQEIVWFNRSSNFNPIRFYPMTERIYWLVKSPETQLINTVGKHDIWNIKPVGTNNEHTRAFPEELVETIIACFPNATNILDPYLGSGTTAVVCKRLKRNYIGFEKEQKYYNLAIDRINNTNITKQNFGGLYK